jgi:site-specific DNA-methyltransferase (adenine-specific)
MKKKQIVISGDNVSTLKNYPDNYFDSVVTDCPYGLGKEPNAEEMLKAWIDTGYLEVKGSGFMGKEWDSFVPQPLFWKEIYRVLKYGGHIVAFFGTRTYDWGCMAIRLGGFEIRDCIQWVYGSGFPKSHNIGKAVDKIQGNEREVIGTSKANGIKAITKSRVEQGYRKNLTIANTRNERTLDKGNSDWEGWGSALKPANEPIVLARKPLEKGLSIAENVLKWGTGGINIDVSRIGTENRSYKGMSANIPSGSGVFRDDNWIPKDIEIEVNGRFPSNFIMTHHEDCECIGTKKVKGSKDGIRIASSEFGQNSGWNDHENKDTIRKGTADKNGEETIEDWNCHEDCPIKILDEQSGISKSSDSERKSNSIGSFGMPNDKTPEYNDKGGASRFFYVAKASQWERNYGLDEFEEKTIEGRDKGQDERAIAYKTRPTPKKNIHPTIKPIKLMQYLIRLVTQPNGIVLDAFAGSGTTGIACKIDGFEFVGLEISEEFTAIANQRIKSFNEEKLLLDETIVFKTRNKKEKTDTNTQTKEQLNLF